MKPLHIARLSTVLVALTFAGGVIAHEGRMSTVATVPNVNTPVTELKWGETGIGPLQASPVFGDLSKGEHATIIKMPAGFASPVHTHTHDYYAIVVTGVVTNASVGEKEIPLPPGSYWLQPGDKPHVTKCISTTECIFSIHQSKKFDFLPVTQ